MSGLSEQDKKSIAMYWLKEVQQEESKESPKAQLKRDYF